MTVAWAAESTRSARATRAMTVRSMSVTTALGSAECVGARSVAVSSSHSKASTTTTWAVARRTMTARAGRTTMVRTMTVMTVAMAVAMRTARFSWWGWWSWFTRKRVFGICWRW